MKLDTFFDNFGLLADAPHGVQKLREMILQLAVQGKLVSQDPEDEPASVLLEKIKAEKERLVKENKIKKNNPLPPIKSDEIPYELPNSWKWERLDNICSYIQRGRGPKYIDESNIPVISQKCIQWDGFKIKRARFVDPSSIEKYTEERFLQTGDLLWNSTGTGTIGRVNVYSHEENLYDLVVADSHVTVVRPTKINSQYIYLFLASPVVQFGFEERASGTTNQIELNTTTVKNQIIAVPPVPEQKRIVAKVDELMALCDALEARKQLASTKCIQLNDVSIHKLLTARGPKKFSKHWQRISDNFDLLYSKPENVNKLRQAILQLAVQGKLVPTDAVVSANGGRKVGDFIKIQNGYAFKSGWYVEKGIKLLRNINIGHGKISWTEATKINKTRAKEYERFQLNEGDIVISLDRPLITTGLKLARIKKDDLPCLLLQRVGRAVFKTDQVLQEFFYLWLQSPLFIDTIDPGRSNGVPHISSKSIETIEFNPPSLLIQKKTIIKTEQIMSLIDKFEANLTKSRVHSGKLLNATITEMLVA